MSVTLNVTNALTGAQLIDLEVDLDSTITDLKQSLVVPSGLLSRYQKLILEDGTELSNDGQTLKEAGLQADSGCISIQLVTPHWGPADRGAPKLAPKLRRLDSVAKYATVLDNFYATEMQAKDDFFKGFDLAALCSEGLRDNPDVGVDKAASNKFVTELFKKFQAECNAAVTARLQEDSKLVFDQYDKSGDGSLAQDEIEKLLADLIVLSQKNLPLTIDTLIVNTRDTHLVVAKLLIKTQFEGHIKAQRPALEGSAFEQELDTMMQTFGPSDDAIVEKIEDTIPRPVLIKAISKLLQAIADDTDTFSKVMAEEMDKNQDGKVDCAEFSAHYCDAMRKVIDIDKSVEFCSRTPV